MNVGVVLLLYSTVILFVPPRTLANDELQSYSCYVIDKTFEFKTLFGQTVLAEQEGRTMAGAWAGPGPGGAGSGPGAGPEPGRGQPGC